MHAPGTTNTRKRKKKQIHTSLRFANCRRAPSSNERAFKGQKVERDQILPPSFLRCCGPLLTVVVVVVLEAVLGDEGGVDPTKSDGLRR